MRSRIKEFLTGILVIAVASTVIVALSRHVDVTKPRLPDSYSDSDLAFQGKRLKGWALGAEGLLADWYWILSLQYIGSKLVAADTAELNIDDLNNLSPRLLYPYLDNTTDLDPKFFAAYSYGAIVLPAVDPEQAIALTEKGIRHNPDRWRLYQYLGYIYWKLDRYEKAAEVYEAGARIPGAPPFMKQMAASMLTKGGSRDVARAMYTQMLNESEDEQSKQNAASRLSQLDALDQLDIINSILSTLIEKTGQCPGNTAQITPLLRTAKLPQNLNFSVDAGGNLVDPSGVPYVLDQQKCSANINFAVSKIPAQ